jgi:hypothetical protein
MNCKVCRLEIEEGNLGQRLSDEAQAHLDSCAGCRLFRDERFKLRGMIGDLEAVNAPADFDFRLRARLADERSAPRRIRWLPTFAPGVQAIALAAAFVMLVGAAAFFRELAPASRTEPRAENVATLKPAESASPITFEHPSESNESTASTSNDEIRSRINEEDFPSMAEGLKNGIALNAPSRVFSKSNPSNPRRRSQSSESAALRALAEEYNVASARGNFGEPLIPLAVNASAQSARVLLDDGRGTSRVVSLEPVTFGAQEMIERKPAARLVSSNSRGIW